MGQQFYNQPPDQGQQPPSDYPPRQDALSWLPPSIQALVPRWFPRDPMALGIIGAGSLFVCMCLIGFCLVFSLLTRPIPTPAPPPTSAAVVPTADPFMLLTATAMAAQPTPIPFDPSKVGSLLNPYFSANLDGMTQIVVDVLDPASGQYQNVLTAVAGSAEMQQFVTAFNIANVIAAPDTACPNHVRFTITRADGTPVVIGVCLKGAVILRGNIPGLGGGDLPMGPYFIDIMLPYLPAAYRQLLGS